MIIGLIYGIWKLSRLKRPSNKGVEHDAEEPDESIFSASKYVLDDELAKIVNISMV